jgi:hypothetical protein
MIYRQLHTAMLCILLLICSHICFAQNSILFTNQNVFLGTQSGLQNTSGISNVFVGYQTGRANTTAGSNTFMGYQAGFSNTTGIANSIIGALAGYSNTIGSYNVFTGPQAGANNTTGSYNMFLGNAAGSNNKTGNNNLAIGDGAGNKNNADQNTYIGTHAGFNNQSGSNNVFIGQDVAQNITNGSNNVFIGWRTNSSGANAATLSNAIAIGANAQVTASNALILGSGVNVGIGNTAPANKLEITQGANGNSGLRFTNLTSAIIPSLSTNQFLTVNSSGDVVLALVGGTKGAFRTTADSSLSAGWNLSDKGNLQNTNTGGVIIGPEINKTPQGYRLYVADGILTEKIKVAVKNTHEWSDKVFETDYELKTLYQVADYIKANKHLPGVPSASEVVEKGVEVVKMDATLLEKIEELTLYSIQQQKEIDQLKQLVKQLLEKNK